MKRSKQRAGKRRPWNPSIGAAAFAMATGRACAAANPTALTDDDLGFLFPRLDSAVAALWANKADAQHVLDVCEALNVTQALVDAGAAPAHAQAVVAAVRAGAEMREAWKSYDKTSGRELASCAQIEAMQEGLDVHKAILQAGLYGHELLQAMDIVKARQRAGQILKVAAS